MTTEQPTWKDISTHSQRDSDRTPRTWRLDAGHLRLIVHRHVHSPGVWFASVNGLFEMRELESRDIEPAKAEALEMVERRLADDLNAVRWAQQDPQPAEAVHGDPPAP